MAEAALAGGAWRWLAAGEWRAHPLRFLVAGLAIAVGVALGFAVHIVNRAAADAFGEAVRSVSGEADVEVRAASPLGFDETLYPRLIRVPGVADASPVVQLRGTIAGVPVSLLGIDMLRAVGVTPRLLGRRQEAAGAESAKGNGRPSIADSVFDDDALYLSRSAQSRLRLKVGDAAAVRVGAREHRFTIVGDMPGADAAQPVAMVDIASAQWRLGEVGKLNRIDLKLNEGAAAERVRRDIAALLPPDARLSDAASESSRGQALSRAYRVNLDMLALVALLTGGFLVYSAQSLSVARRLRQFALLRTLGMQRRALVAQLLAEGSLLGLAGSLAGLALGYALAVAIVRLVGGDLGSGYFAGEAPELGFAPGAALMFVAFGIATAIVGSFAPARAAARVAPAEALKNAGDAIDPRTSPRWWPAMVLIAAGGAAATLPAVGRLPLFGYAAMAFVLAGGVAAMPWLARALLKPLARIDTRSPFDLALRRLLGAPSQASVALGGIVASTGLMIAMAVMVTSFRGSVDEWLESFLSADLYVAPPGGGLVLDPAMQARLAAVPGVGAISFSKAVPIVLDPALPSVQLIVRPVGGPGYALPLIERASVARQGIALWVSEPAARLYALKPGERLRLPIGRGADGYVAGIWRDYARQSGAIMIDSRAYVALTGDRDRDEAAIELAPGASPMDVQARLRRVLAGSSADIADPAALRRLALTLFDRSFAITYVLEAIAILIGLAGVAATISAQTLARTKEFGMLRHIGMTPRQIVGMLAGEGALLGLIGMAAGIALGLGLSQILIHVINPQSFNWTMDTRLPLALILSVAAALIVTAAVTAILAGRHLLAQSAVRAVSEDW
jgi:putative ABC transport system permease protein